MSKASGRSACGDYRRFGRGVARLRAKCPGYVVAALATLGGGSLFGTCEVRVHDALAQAGKDTIIELVGGVLTDLVPQPGLIEGD